MKPSCEQILEYAKDYDVVPVCREMYADIITPIGLLKKIARQSSYYYLLESVEGGEKWGRYSFLGYDPVMRVYCQDGTVTIEDKGGSKTVQTRRPM